MFFVVITLDQNRQTDRQDKKYDTDYQILLLLIIMMMLVKIKRQTAKDSEEELGKYLRTEARLS